MYFISQEISRNHIFSQDFKYSKIHLTKEHISLIEETKFLALHEKIKILQLATKSRITVGINGNLLDKFLPDQDGEIMALPQSYKEDVLQFLEKLPFPITTTKLYRKVKGEEKTRELFFYQLCVNKFSSLYISNYWQTFSAHEHGIFFGYPITTIQAHLGLIEQIKLTDDLDKFTVAMSTIGPYEYSVDFLEDEKRYYDRVWEQITKISPKLAKEADKEWEEFKAENRKL